MSTTEDPRQIPARAVRDAAAAALIMGAVAVMLVLAFTVEWRLGVAAIALLAFVGGILLGLD